MAAAIVGGWPGSTSPDRLPAGPPDRPAAGPPGRLGIQLYTLRDLLRTDLEATLAGLARIGYREVELAGTYGRTPADFRAILDRAGLKAPAGHVSIPAISDTLDQTIIDAKTLGHHYLIVPWLPEEMRNPDGYARIADTFNRAGERLKRAGLALGYHNHSFEFAAVDGDRCGYDILLEKTDSRLVTMELDLFWIRKGGKDALVYFTKHPHRFRLVHIKDMAADGAMVDVGQGVMEWSRLLSAARKAGVKHFFVEHDEARDPVAFARTSYAYLREVQF